MKARSVLSSPGFLSLVLALAACDSGSSDPAPEAKAAAAKTDATKADPSKDEAKTDEAKTDEAKTDETKTDETKTTESKTDETKTDETKTDESKTDEAKTDEAKTDETKPDQGKAEPGSSMPMSALYWASGNEGKTTIDIIDIPAKGDDDPVMALSEAHDYPDGIDEPLPRDATLPAGFGYDDAWTVATTKGPVAGKAVAYGAMGGASEGHFIVVLDAEASGLAARTDQWRGAIPTLREAKTAPLAKAIRKAAWPAIVREAEARAKSTLRRPRGWKGTLEAVEGSFGDGFTHLVAMVPPETDEIGDEHLAGLVLVDATGRTKAVFAPSMTIDVFTVLYLVDIEGDGRDEVVLDSSYYEGSYTLLLSWDAAGGLSVRTLTGDGA